MLWFKFDYLMIWLHAFQTWEWVHVLFWAMTKDKYFVHVEEQREINYLYVMEQSHYHILLLFLSQFMLWGVFVCLWSVLRKTHYNSQLVISLSKMHGMKTARMKNIKMTTLIGVFFYPCYELYFFEFSLQVQRLLHQHFKF